jgi:hypothetical protein
MGILLGTGAGMLGAYAGWRRAWSPGAASFPRWVAAATLGFALGLGAVVTRIQSDPATRLILLLPVVLLGYWFVRQVRAIRVSRGKKSEDHRGRCQQ